MVRFSVSVTDWVYICMYSYVCITFVRTNYSHDLVCVMPTLCLRDGKLCLCDDKNAVIV